MKSETKNENENETKMIVVIGSSNTDMVMRVREFPRPGETILGESYMQNQGGKGANQAVACARLGGNTSFVGKLGQDALATATIAHLRQEGIDVSHLTQTPTSPSGTAFIMVDSHGENSIIVHPGANAELKPMDIDAAQGLIANNSLVLMKLETPIPTLVHAARMDHQHGATVVLNPAPAPAEGLPAELFQHVDVLIPNETEVERLTGKTVEDEASLLAALQELHGLGVRQVVVTLGARGAMTIQDGQPLMVASPRVEAVDTTAAGDTFCGALCVELSKGASLDEAMQFACRAAALTVTRMGAQQSIPKREEVSI